MDHLGPPALRAFGVAWAVLASAYVGAAVVVWRGDPRWPRVLAAVTLASLGLVLVALWSSVIGLAIDLALLVIAGAAGTGRIPGASRSSDA